MDIFKYRIKKGSKKYICGIRSKILPKDLVIPDDVYGIYDDAFSSDTIFESIRIHENIEYIPDKVLYNNNRFVNIELDENNKNFIIDDNLIINKKTRKLIRVYDKRIKDESILIPNYISIIGDYAFEGCTSLKNITLPDGLVKLGIGSFKNCTSLEEIVLPKGITKISEETFANCFSLNNVKLSPFTKELGLRSFYYCKALEHIDLPENIKILGNSSFRNCTSLKEIVLPNGIIKINEGTFLYCLSLNNVKLSPFTEEIGLRSFCCCKALEHIDLPENIKILGNSSFKNCTSLKEIKISKNIYQIDNNVFNNCSSLEKIEVDENNKYYKLDSNCLIDLKYKKLIKAFDGAIIPNYVETIGNCAFECYKLTKEIDIPDNVKKIEGNPFSSLRGLNSIYIPNTVKFRNYNMFSDKFFKRNKGIFIGTNNEKLYYKLYNKYSEEIHVSYCDRVCELVDLDDD